MVRAIYLTIDDGPSQHTLAKIEYLQKHKIPAIFYCRGEHIEKYKTHAVALIKAGFILGNHSYSHPAYSNTTQEIFFAEILKTERLLNECYEQAGIKREHKIIRLPFGDRGSGEASLQLQFFLKQEHFEKVDFKDLKHDTNIDSLWTLDPFDYKRFL